MADDVSDVGSSPKRTTLTFEAVGAEAGALKFVGRWFDVANLKLGGEIQSVIGPNLVSQDPDGKRKNGFLVASPYENARHVLFITCEALSCLGPEPEMMLFYGESTHAR